MTDFSEFHFIRPFWLIALIPLLIFIIGMIKHKLGNRSWEAVCDEALLPYVLMGGASKSRRYSVLFVTLGGLLSIFSLAGPTWEKLPQPVFTTQNALVIALDLSRSMDATDVNPSRLVRARYKISDILETRKEGQTALLVYAGDAFTVTPLTDDIATIQSQLPALDTGIMPLQGSRTDMAIELGSNLLKQAGLTKGDILLISDEVDINRSQTQMLELNQQGYRLSILGMGTEHGAPISMPDGSFLKDNTGQIVIPTLDESQMRTLSDLGGGTYFQMSMNDDDIKKMDQYFSGIDMEDGFELSEMEADVWKEQGPWLLLILLPITAIMFRRGYIVVLILFLIPFPEQANAFDWDSLWLNAEQRGKRLVAEGNHEQAVELFKDPAWKGSAQYKAGAYPDALQSLEQTSDIESSYNAGNSLARLGKYEEAISMYDNVLEQYPEHEDALFNKELLEEELKKQEQEEQQQNQDENQEESEEQQSENQEQQQDQGEQEQQEQQASNDNQDQQQQEQQQQDQESESQDGKQDQQNQQADAEQEQDEQQQNEEQQQTAQTDEQQPDEEQQATEQWLRRIPDDPGGLLRRKFLYQYQQRSQRATPNEKPW
jgi:Ca-activated chloride channel family protein